MQTSDSWLLQNVTEQNLNQPEWIIEGLAQGKMTAVCDGSYQPALSENWVSAAWQIETQPRQYICGKATVAGHVADAYRGELLGIYGILTLIKQIEQMHPTYAKGSIEIGCDNKSAGWMSGAPCTRTAANTRHMDLIKAIRRIKQDI